MSMKFSEFLNCSNFELCSKGFDPRFALLGSSAQYAPSRDFKTTHLKLELEVDFNSETLLGKCTVHTSKLRDFKEFRFNAACMKVKNASVDDKKTAFKYDGEVLLVENENKATAKQAEQMQAEQVVVIEYEVAKPKLGLFFVKPDSDYPNKPIQAWTHSETSEARYWYPCHDEPETKCTSEIAITVPAGFIAVSNGIEIIKEKIEEKKEKNKNGKKTFYWRMDKPNSVYLNSFAVGKFAVVKDNWNEVEISLYCQEGREEDAKRAFEKTKKCMKIYSEKIGFKYPYEKYAQVAVADFIYGGMEHTTCTTQTDSALQDEIARNETPEWPDELMAHELAHQWFGDLLTCRDWQHAWLNESFATYLSAIFTEEDKGKDEFLYQLHLDSQSYFYEDEKEHRRAIVTNIYKEPSDLFDRHLYQKGCCVLHFLRRNLGDELWWKAIKQYVQLYAHGTVETSNFANCIRNSTGFNATKFFDEWIYSSGHPEFKIDYWWSKSEKKAFIRVIQKQKTENTPLFEVNTKIDFILKDDKRVSFIEKISKKDQTFKYKLASEPLLARFDPDSDLFLKKVEFNKDYKMLTFQLKHDENPINRIQAANELAKNHSLETVNTLKEALINEKYWGAQCEIADALASIETEHAQNALIAALPEIKNNKVKSAVLNVIGEFKNQTSFETASKYLNVKNSYVVPMAALSAVGKAQHSKSLELIKPHLNRTSFLDEVQAGAIRALNAIATKESLEILLQKTKRGNSERARLNAIRLLPKTQLPKETILNCLLELTKDPYALVQLAAVTALGELSHTKAKTRLKEIMETKHLDPRVKRQAQIATSKIDGGIETEDIETLKQELAKLKTKEERKEEKPQVNN